LHSYQISIFMKTYMSLFNEFRKDYMIYVPLSIIFQSCLGSIVILYLLQMPYSIALLIKVTLCTILCMAYNASVLAQLKVKWVFNLLLMSVIVNLVLLISTMIT